MNVVQEEILLTQFQDEYLIALPLVFDWFRSINDRLPDETPQIIVLVYRYKEAAQYGFVYKFVGAKVK